MIIYVHIKEKTIEIQAGPATQPIQWLAHVALTRYSPQKTNYGLKLGIPNAIQRDSGEVLDENARIIDTLAEKEHIWVVLGDEQVQSRLPQKLTSTEEDELKYMYEELYDAIRRGDMSQVKRLIEKEGVPPNEMFNNQKPIHLACTERQGELVKYFIDSQGINPEELDGYDRSPLQLALESGDLETIKYLLENKNVSVDQELGIDGLTPLSLAAKFQGGEEIALEIVKYLFERWNVDLNREDSNATVPIYWTLSETIINTQVANYLLENGVPANQTLKPTGDTVLELAARRHCHSVVEKILSLKNNKIQNHQIDAAIVLAQGNPTLQKLLSDSK